MISIIVVCAAVVSAIVDYQFKIISSETLRTETDLVGFFGQFYAATGASTLLLQFVVASIAFQRFGVVLVMATLPFMLGLGSAAVLIWPVLWSAVLSRFSDQTFRFTLHNGGLELLWLPVSPELRREAKPFIGGSLKSITEGGVGLLIYGLLHFLTAAQLSIVSLAFCFAWTGSLLKLRSLYVTELQSAIASRRLPPEDLEVSATDALTVRVIDRALLHGDTAQTLFVLELIAKLPLTPWRNTILRLLQEGGPEVKARILEIAARDRTIVTNEILTQLASGTGAEGVEAIRAIGTAGADDLREAVNRRLEDREPSIRAAACATLIKLNGTGSRRARETLRSMLGSREVHERVAALEEGSRVGGALDAEALEAALADPSQEVRAKGLQAAAAHPDGRHARAITASLSNPALFAAARNALAALPPDVVLPALTAQLDKKMPLRERRASLQAMRICLLPATYSALLNEVDADWPVLANQASESLLKIARQMPAPPDAASNAEARRSHLVRAVCTLNDLHQELLPLEGTVLLRDYLQSSVANFLPAIVRLAALERPDAPIETCIEILHTQDRARLPFVLELLDTLLTPAERHNISPLLELSSARAQSLKPTAITTEASSRVSSWLAGSIYAEDEWLSAIALDYVLTERSQVLAEQINWDRLPTTPLNGEVVAVHTRRNRPVPVTIPTAGVGTIEEDRRPMLTTLEKTILLKSVPLFEAIPGEELSRVAQIAEEKEFSPGETIFRDGDFADCLYIIVTGSVRIQKRGKELAVLAKGHPLGEMAVLDSSPRSADATTAETTATLRVGQEQFLEIMQSNSQIMKGVIRMLLNRLRLMDDRLAGAAQAAGGTGSA
jgi:hypothetical protein